MPAQTYEVNKQELNKVAQRDQSYRNCLGALLAFFFLCLILILVPWHLRSSDAERNHSGKKEFQHGKLPASESTTATTENTVRNDVTIKDFSTRGFDDSHEGYKYERTQKEATTTTSKTDVKDHFTEKDPEQYDKERQSETTFTGTTLSANDEDSTEMDLNNRKEDKTTTTNDEDSTEMDLNNRKEDKTTTTKYEYTLTTPQQITDVEAASTHKITTFAITHEAAESSTEKNPKWIYNQEEDDDAASTADENISTTLRQTTNLKMTSISLSVSTDASSIDEYNSSEKPEVTTMTPNISTSTSPTRSTNLAEDTTTDSTTKHVTPEDITYGVTTSTLSTLFAQSSSDDTSADAYEYAYDHNSEKPEVTTMKLEFRTLPGNTISSDFVRNESTVSTSGDTMSTTEVTTDNVASSTSPTRLDNLEGNSAEKLIGIRETSKANVVTSTMNPSINPEDDANTGYYSNDSQRAQTVVSIIYNTAKTTISTASDPEEDKRMKSVTERQEVASTATGYHETINNNGVTEGNSLVAETHTPNKYILTTAKITNNPEDMIVTESVSRQMEQSSTHKYTYDSTSSSTMPRIHITSSASHIDMTTVTTPLSDKEKEIRTMEYCNRTASKMMSYMNHFADPCDDFYEYACGGFEANSQLMDGDLVRQAENYKRIAKQMAKEKHENVHSTFATYYDSCVQYERTVNFNERVEMAIDALKDVGEFYINVTWSNEYKDFTNLFIQLILHHSALLFDVMPKFDKYHPTNITLQINPLKYENPFMTGHKDDLCLEDEFETEQQHVNLETLYAEYKNCNKNKEELLRSVKEALTAFSVFKSVNDSHLQSQYIEKTVRDIKSFIMQGYFSNFPSKDQIQKTYAMNTYKTINLENLQNENTFINWTQLISSLIGTDMMEVNLIHNNDLHIYLYQNLKRGLSELEKFAEEDPMSLNNAIMALYAHKLYRELVVSKYDDVKDHCLQVASNLLRLEASSLYVSSFSDQEIKKMDQLIRDTFNDLKQTLRMKTEEIKWGTKSGQDGLLEKINNLKLSLPDLSFYKDRNSLYSDYNMPQIELSNNYFNNSMILLKRYRTLMYAALKGQTNRERQIWAHYATPFQSKAGINSVNVVMIPYGIIDWSTINEEHALKYITLATLGNLIAHQIAHHFDNNGLYYWQSSRDEIEDEEDNMDLEDYISCHKYNLYKAPMNFTLPLTKQTVSLTIPLLTLNERLSDLVGFRLAYDTLVLTKPETGKQLPWIKLSVKKLFYLAYAQMYCTKSPLTSSYVSLYENENLPNRIRVFASVSNNKFVADDWNCPTGSQIAPIDVCSVFPYKETTQQTLPA